MIEFLRLFESPRTEFHIDDDEADSFENHYSHDHDVHGLQAKKGRHVTWFGPEGRMMRVYPEYVFPRSDNIFDNAKLAAISKEVRRNEDVKFECGYASVSEIDYNDVVETRRSKERIYEFGMDEPWSAGWEVDEYLDNTESTVENWATDFLSDQGEEFYDYYYDDFVHIELGYNDVDVEDIKPVDEHPVALAMTEHLKAKVAEMHNTVDGDIGQFSVQMRDGNHRVFGSLHGGEPFVYVTVSKQNVRNGNPRLLKALE